MLACARLGAVHSVVFGGFAAGRTRHPHRRCRPKLIISASCGVETDKVIAYKPLLDDAIELARHKPAHCIILQRPQHAGELMAGRDIDWARERCAGARRTTCVPVRRPIRSISSTPPARPASPRASCATMAAMPSRSTGAWRMSTTSSRARCSGPPPMSAGSSAIPTSSMARCSMAPPRSSIEGKPVGTPDAGAFWRVIAEHGVVALFTAPTAFRAIKRDDPDGKLIRGPRSLEIPHPVPRRRAFRSRDPRMGRGHLRVPVIDHWWQTESGWPMAANCMGIEPLPVKHGSPTRAVPGWDIRVVDERATR